MNHHISTILIVDDDEGHAILIRENLESAGMHDRIVHFRDGQAILDLLTEYDYLTTRQGLFLKASYLFRF